MDEGFDAFQRGDIEGAASKWQDAVRLYARGRQPQAHSVALLHLAYAYEALGYYSRAVESLHAALRLAEEAADPAQLALVLNALGYMAITTGNVADAAWRLRDAMDLARNLGDAGLTATILHTHGHLLLAQQQLPAALAAYQESATFAQQAQQPGIAARALAHAALVAEQHAQFQSARELLNSALVHLRQAEPSHDTAYELLSLGRSYQRLAATDATLVLSAAEMFQAAGRLAQTLQDSRALSYAWGYLGRLYEEERRYQEALEVTRRAALAAQQVQSPESLYLWQWQTGRILRALGDFPAATAAYERAVTTVQSLPSHQLRRVRSTVTPIRAAVVTGSRGIRRVSAPGGKTSSPFRDLLGPLYFELSDLLLRQAAALEGQAQQAAHLQYAGYLQQARLTVEQFKTAELRDYFGDECVAAIQPRVTALEQVSADTVIVYPILLPDRLELLVSLPTGLKRVAVAVSRADLEQRLQDFHVTLHERDALRYLQPAKDLYTWLIQPLAMDLAAWPIRTIVFVPDGPLRTLPWSALYDGQQFLVEKYALAITPSLTLTEPRPLPQGDVQILAVGVANPVEQFPPLPYVVEELRNIQQRYGGTMLLDRDFSAERLEQSLRQGDFGIVHIASHGQFAAAAAESFLLTGQGRLTMDRLSQMLSRLRFRDRPIELLTLSACETAQGDDLAALGLAGVAIQAGVRSALATLWQVRDDATAVFMTTFYQQLQQAGTSRARALQQAQLALLRQPQYTEPYFWAPFLLINNWL
jgi:CHAT domain-containing protein